jgi:hypothetical protein
MKTIPIEIKKALAGGEFIVNEFASDRFLIEIPMDIYMRCLVKCDEKSPEYRLLRNGIVLRDDPRNVMMHIRCDADKVRVIRGIVAQECREFLDEVHVYPDLAGC